MVKQKSNKFKCILSDFQVITAEDDRHELSHTQELVWIGSNRQNLSFFFASGMVGGIHTDNLSLYEALFFIETEEHRPEEVELPHAKSLQLACLCKILSEQLANVLAVQFRQQGHEKCLSL